jgi:TetR/AcrR family transcriptional repressor of nem operon
MKPATPTTSRTRLLDAALSVIRSKGYTATTVDDLCAAAGVTKGAFFHHFDSKEGMAVQAAKHWSEVTTDLFANAPYRQLADPLARVFGYIDFRMAIIKGEVPEFTCFVGTMVQETYGTSNEIRQACERSIFSHAADVARDIEAARALYLPDGSWTSESLANYTQAVLQGSFILAKAKNDPEVAIDSIVHLRRYIELLFSNAW